MTRKFANKALSVLWGVIFTFSAFAADPAFESDLAAWKKDRVAFLKSETGYLNLVGLFWLQKPVSTFGSDVDSDLVFPSAAPGRIGEFEVLEGQVTMRVANGVHVTSAGNDVDRITMRDDLSDNPVVIRQDRFAWTVINRDGNFAVRLRDFEHPSLSSFGPIEYYPTDVGFRVTGRLDPYEVPREVRIDTVIEGLDYKPQSPGLVRFELDGEDYALEAYLVYDGLLFVFGDKTSGRQTYPAGRFLYTALPDADGFVTLDFNRAENPPCAFNEFATCPIASRRNRLPITVAAGEKYEAGIH